ncbi:MAG: hypothetical protein CMH27_05370 [Micavibrio sp.]|nr:hypothetical protein [Micavibrio sp.]
MAAGQRPDLPHKTLFLNRTPYCRRPPSAGVYQKTQTDLAQKLDKFLSIPYVFLKVSHIYF